MEEDELVLITFKLKAKPQSMVVALLWATLFKYVILLNKGSHNNSNLENLGNHANLSVLQFSQGWEFT